MLANHCMWCHRDGGIAPFALTDIDSVRDKAHFIIEQVESGAMPPFSARTDPDCAPRSGFVGDPRLSSSEQATLEQWMTSGFPAGQPVSPPPIPSPDMASVTTTLVPVEGWTASGDRDQFVCTVFDVGNPATTWLTGLQVRPDNAAIVHHALIYVMAPETAEPLVTQHGLGHAFECDGLPPADQVHAWFPGNQPLVLPDDMGMPIAAGAKIAVRIHYHPHGGVHGVDRTALDLRLQATRPSQLYLAVMFGNETTAPGLLPGPGDTMEGVPEFVVPSNVADHVEHMRIPVPSFGLGSGVRVLSVVPHMHLLGTRLRATLERANARGHEPSTECLSNGGWNFDWQRTYMFDLPFERLPPIAVGDILDLQCSWNNTVDNPFMQRLLVDTHRGQPFDVPFGEQTSDEMCLTIMGFVYNAPL